MARAKKKKQDDEILNTEIQTAETAESVESAEVVETSEETETSDDAQQQPKSKKAPKPDMTQDDIRLVEAILFASSSSVSEGMIAERFPEDRAVLIPDILEHLKEHYAARGVTLVQRDKRWALRTAADLGDQMRLEKEQPKKFTRAAMETMAVVAYHQPVTRAEIENIRGVATSPGALDALMEAGWIKPGKRREVPGRPVTWLSTQAFLDHFGLERIEDLPGMDELKAAGLLDKRPAIEAMPTADLFGDDEAKKDEEDPNEITDEDLLGRKDSDDEEEEGGFETTMSADSDSEDDDDDFDDEDGDEDESDDEDLGDDEMSDDESSDDEDSDDDDEYDDDDGDDEDDEDDEEDEEDEE